jgi:hypothetical protein
MYSSHTWEFAKYYSIKVVLETICWVEMDETSLKPLS